MKNLKHEIRIVFVMLVIFAFNITINAQSLRAVIFAATEDATIGKGVKKSVEFLKNDLSKIAQNAGLTFVPYYNEGNDFNLSNLEDSYLLLQNEDLTNDVVLFYFLGHGFKSKIEHPNLIFLNTKGIADELLIEQNSVNLKEINNNLHQLNARLTITVGEACNDELEFDTEINTKDGFEEMKLPVADKKRYERLFSKTSGNFILWSSQSGEVSYISPTQGGVFTQAFLMALRSELAKSRLKIDETSWKRVVDKTRKNAKDIAKDNKLNVQNLDIDIVTTLRVELDSIPEETNVKVRYGFLTKIVSFFAPNKVQRSFKRALKNGDLLALEEILAAGGEKADKIRAKMEKESPVTFYTSEAIIYEEKGDTVNALINYKIAYELSKSNSSKRDLHLIKKMKKLNKKTKPEPIKGLNERNYHMWLKSKFYQMEKVYKDDSEIVDMEIDQIKSEIDDINNSIAKDEAEITQINQEIIDDNKDIDDLKKQVEELDIKRKQRVEIKLNSVSPNTRKTIQKIERYMDDVEKSGQVDNYKKPKYIDDAVVEFKFEKRKTSAMLKPTAKGFVLGKHCTPDIENTATAVMSILLKPADDVPVSKRFELKAKIKISGHADWQGANNGNKLGIYYTAKEDIFQDYTNRDGVTKNFHVNRGERKNITNEELAFLRAYCAFKIIEEILYQKGITDYSIQFEAIEHDLPANIAKTNKTEGAKYRGVDITLIVENLYKHYVDEIRAIETDIEVIETKVRGKRARIKTLKAGIDDKYTQVTAKEDEIKVKEVEKEELAEILKIKKADGVVKRVKSLQQ